MSTQNFKYNEGPLIKFRQWWIKRKNPNIEDILNQKLEFLEKKIWDFNLHLNYTNFLSYSKKKWLQKEINEIKRNQSKEINIWKQKFAFIKQNLEEISYKIPIYNKNYIENQKQIHKSFFMGNEVKSERAHSLNEDQIDSILTDDDFSLAIAGPGAGKTRTLVFRVAFYVLKKGINPQEILILAFNKSIGTEIQKRLEKEFGITDVQIYTFHALGFKILGILNPKLKRTLNVETNPRSVIRSIFSNLKSKNPDFQDEYFKLYTNIYENSSEDDTTVFEAMIRSRSQKNYKSINNIYVRSLAEREIANFFFIHDIKFEYEPVVEWCDKDESGRIYRPDFYLPDYDIYLEHWAIPQGGEVPSWFSGDTTKYQSEQDWKISQFTKYQKILWETDYQDWKSERLDAKLVSYCKRYGIEITRIDFTEIVEKIDNLPEIKYTVEDSINDIIQSSKSLGINSTQLEKIKKNIQSNTEKVTHFQISLLELSIPVFQEYEKYLLDGHKIDFEDMINRAYYLLEHSDDLEKMIWKMNFKYILVDEFQDISLQRFRFLLEFRKKTRFPHLFCVGDDWQAIYGFSGASSKYLVEFETYVGPYSLILMKYNYRNPPKILEYGQNVIEKCTPGVYTQKTLIPFASADISRSIFVHRIDVNIHNFEIKQSAIVLKLIQALINRGVRPAEIMVLSRYNFGYSLLYEKLKENGIPLQFEKSDKIIKSGVRFYSLHKAKGLEAEYVLIINVINGLWGFPSEIKGAFDTKIINPDLSFAEDEERRLFYVGMTRAKIQVHLFTNNENRSKFIDEIIDFSQNTQKDERNIFPDVSLNPDKIWCSIFNQTEKAILCAVKDPQRRWVKIWIPKKQIISKYNPSIRKFQEIQILSNYTQELQRNSNFKYFISKQKNKNDSKSVFNKDSHITKEIQIINH